MSDGTAFLSIRDPESFTVLKKITVHDSTGPIADLNELEYARDALFANVWKEDIILRINPANGAVTGYFDLGELPKPVHGCEETEKVANGIAFAEDTGLLYVTGKLWPYVFVLKVNFYP